MKGFRGHRFPNASPGERLVAWPPAPPDRLGRGPPAVVALPLPAARPEAAPVPAHNFGLLRGDGRVVVFGGRARSAATGVAAFYGDDDLAFAEGRLAVNGSHPGCAELRRGTRLCEWDGRMSAARVAGAVRLYGRLNTRTSRRWVQVASAPAPDAPFGPFAPLAVLGFDGCRLRRASVYFAAVGPNPVDAATVLALLPLHEGAGACVIALAASIDGLTFGPPTPLLDARCEDGGRTRDYPVDGLVRRDDAVFFYVHRDMPTDDLVDARDLPPVHRLVRHALHASWLANFTAAQVAALAAAPPRTPDRAPDGLPPCLRPRPPRP